MFDSDNEKDKYSVSYTQGLSIASINVRGILSDPLKQRELLNWVISSNFDIICIQEWRALF